MKRRLFLLLCLLLFPVVALAERVSIDGTEYTTQDAALTALTEGKTLKFEENSTDSWVFEGKTNITIDLNGKTVHSITLRNCTATVKNGTLLGTSGSAISIGGYQENPSTVTVNGVTLSESSTIGKESIATYVDVTTDKNVANYGNLTIESGTYSTVRNEGTLLINNGTFTSNSTALVENRAGTVTIKSGTFSGSATFIYSTYGSEKHSAIIDNANYNGGGTILSVGSGSVTVNGGTFTTTNTVPINALGDGEISFNGGKLTALKATQIGGTAGRIDIGKKSETPQKNDPIIDIRNGKVFIWGTNFHFYGGTMYLKEAIDTNSYKSEVKLYDLVYEKQSDGSYKAYLKKSTVQEDAIWTKFKKAFKSNDVLSALKKDTSKEITIKDNGSSISYTVKDKTTNTSRTVTFSYANGIISLSNPIKASDTANKGDLYKSVADMNAISNALKAFADVKGYKYEQFMPFIFANANILKIAKDGAEFNYKSVPYKGADMTAAEKKAFGTDLVQYELTTVFKLDLKNGVKTFNDMVPEKESSNPYMCKRVDGVFYDKNGNVVTKAEYEKLCPEKVPDTGFIIPSVIVGILSIAFVVYKKFNFKNKLTRI